QAATPPTSQLEDDTDEDEERGMPSKRRNEVGFTGNGGQFAPTGRQDAEVSIATDQQVLDALPHSPGFQIPVLDGRDSAETVDFGLDGVPSDFTTWYDEETGETVAEVGVYVPDAAITGTEDIDPFSAATSDEDEQKVQRASVVLDQVLRERYPVAEVSYDTEEPRLSWQYRTDGMSTREAMHEQAWNEPHGPVTFANEADPGTFGSENLGRVFREQAGIERGGPGAAADEAERGTFGSERRGRVLRGRMGDTSMVAVPTVYADRSLEGALTRADDVNHMVARQEFIDGAEVEMPTDANVRTYARMLAEHSDQMRSLAEKGHCSTSTALEELDQVALAPANHGASGERFEAFQLSRWIDRSNQELAEEWDLGCPRA